MTPQKKAAVNAKRRRQYAARKAEKDQQSSSMQQPELDRIQPTPPVSSIQPQEEVEQLPKQTSQPEGLAFKITATPAARRKNLQRARSGMLQSPSKYVPAVFNLQDKASPRKKALFQAAMEQRLNGNPAKGTAKYMDDAACG